MIDKLRNPKIISIIIILIVLFALFYWQPVSEFVGLSDNDSNTNGNGSASGNNDDGTCPYCDDDDDTSDNTWTPISITTGNGVLSYGGYQTWNIPMSGYESGTTRTEVEYEWHWVETCQENTGHVEFALEDSTNTVRWGKADTEPQDTYGSPEIAPNMVWDGINPWKMSVGNWAPCKISYKFRITIYELS